MSSTYRALCLSHDPAIVIGGPDEGWQSGENGIGIMQDALQFPADCELLAGHEQCELLGGRFSSPLIEVYCSGRTSSGLWHRLPHNRGQWIDVEWLRLLATAHASSDELMSNIAMGMPECWSRTRLWRLRELLGLHEKTIARWKTR